MMMLERNFSLKAAAVTGLALSALLLIPLVRTGRAMRAAVLSAQPPETSVSEPEIRGVLGNAQTDDSGGRVTVLPELPEGAYLVKLSGNILSVFPEGSREPSAQYELPAGWLPDYDRILLEYGIRADSAYELRGLLEDYVT